MRFNNPPFSVIVTIEFEYFATGLDSAHAVEGLQRSLAAAGMAVRVAILSVKISSANKGLYS